MSPYFLILRSNHLFIFIFLAHFCIIILKIRLYFHNVRLAGWARREISKTTSARALRFFALAQCHKVIAATLCFFSFTILLSQTLNGHVKNALKSCFFAHTFKLVYLWDQNCVWYMRVLLNIRLYRPDWFAFDLDILQSSIFCVLSSDRRLIV